MGAGMGAEGQTLRRHGFESRPTRRCGQGHLRSCLLDGFVDQRHGVKVRQRNHEGPDFGEGGRAFIGSGYGPRLVAHGEVGSGGGGHGSMEPVPPEGPRLVRIGRGHKHGCR